MELFVNVLSSNVSSGATSGSAGGVMGMLVSLLPFALVIALMYFLMIRPQKKRQKKEEEMRKNICVGDEILTIGGFYGRVMSVKDDELVIESLGDRSSKQRIASWAVQQNLTVHDDVKKK
jgi:preprotein translocase subunit YajC